MNSIQVDNVGYVLPNGETLFENVNFTISGNEKASIVGPNGVGKTTLLNIIAQKLHSDFGDVNSVGDISFVSQSLGFSNDSQTISEALTEVLPDNIFEIKKALTASEDRLNKGDTSAANAYGDFVHQWSQSGGYEIEDSWQELLTDLAGAKRGLSLEDPISSLSGGERKRLLLKAAFTHTSNILLLDEPDNYLDVAGKEWLEKTIKDSDKLVLCVSHDREMLTNAMDKLITIERSGSWVHGHNFSTYMNALSERRENQLKKLKGWQKEERRLYRRYKDLKQKASISSDMAATAEAAKSRWERFVEKGKPQVPGKIHNVKMRFKSQKAGAFALDVIPLLDQTQQQSSPIRIKSGSKIGLVGNNGAGKTTLLESIVNDGANINLGHNIKSHLVTQAQLSARDSSSDVKDWLRTKTQDSEEQLRSRLARYGLAKRFDTPVKNLSGGQLARLELMVAEINDSNLLLLDEPTENLDVQSAYELQRAIEDFPGTIICSTHDRALLKLFDDFIQIDDSGEISVA